MKDKRNLLRADPPDGSNYKAVGLVLDAADYEKLYWIAFEKNQSLVQTVRDLIRDAAKQPRAAAAQQERAEHERAKS